MKDRAQELLSVLEAMIESLEKPGNDLDSGTLNIVRRLKRHSEAFKIAITETKEKRDAHKAVKYLNSIITDIDNATSCVPGSFFSQYWDLNTLFQDRRFSDDPL
ncbi:MAG: hypothetical protein OCD01_12980 [Fibrobacterales bacterium]